MIDDDENLLERRWRYLLHADNLFTNRINLLLVAESLLVLSYISSFGIDSLRENGVSFAIAVIGTVITAIFWFVSNRQRGEIEDIKCRIEKLDEDYKQSRENRKFARLGILAAANFWLGTVFPLLFIPLWLFLLSRTL